MRAFVTGGTGLIGRALVDALLQRDWEATILTRDPVRAEEFRPRGAKIVSGDVTRPTFQSALSRADVVFHVAGWLELGIRDVPRMYEVNLAGTRNVLSMARKENVGRVVYTSTAGVFAPAATNRPATESSEVRVALDDPYVRSKVEAHRAAVREMEDGLPLTIVLPAAVFGPYDTGQLGRSLALLVRRRLTRLPKGFGTNTWTHSSDIAEGHLLAATKGRSGQMYVLGDRVLPLATFYREAADFAGVPHPKVDVPMRLARLAARFSEAAARFSRKTPLLSRAALALAAIDLVVDSTKARTELGWSPHPFEERLREAVDWYASAYRDRHAPLPAKPGGGIG